MPRLSDIAPTLLAAYPASFYTSDTAKDRFDLNLAEPDDAFLTLCLGILYAFPIQPSIADNTLRAICADSRSKHLFGPSNMGRIYAERLAALPYADQLAAVPGALSEQFALLNREYRRIPRLVLLSMARAGHKVMTEADGDVLRLFSICGFDGAAVIRRLQSWHVRLDIKAFWLCREIRQQQVWRDPSGALIDGAFCCVVDIQVKRALEHLGCLDPGRDIFYHSRMIWNAFGELYDFPLLWLARTFCSRKERLDCPMSASGYCRGGKVQMSLPTLSP